MRGFFVLTLLSSFITIGFRDAYALIRSLNECCLDKGVFDEALSFVRLVSCSGRYEWR
jgi:hypothetical protein